MNARDPRTYAIIGAAMEVHGQLGCGFLEAVYQEALAIEFDLREIPYRREVDLPVSYKKHCLATHYRADFVCYDTVIVELKALSKLGGTEQAQIINYLKATGLETGLISSLRAASLEYKRLIIAAQNLRHRRNRRIRRNRWIRTKSVMFFSNSLLDTDAKGFAFCPCCQRRLEGTPRRAGDGARGESNDESDL